MLQQKVMTREALARRRELTTHVKNAVPVVRIKSAPATPTIRLFDEDATWVGHFIRAERKRDRRVFLTVEAEAKWCYRVLAKEWLRLNRNVNGGADAYEREARDLVKAKMDALRSIYRFEI